MQLPAGLQQQATIQLPTGVQKMPPDPPGVFNAKVILFNPPAEGASAMDLAIYHEQVKGATAILQLHVSPLWFVDLVRAESMLPCFWDIQ